MLQLERVGPAIGALGRTRLGGSMLKRVNTAAPYSAGTYQFVPKRSGAVVQGVRPFAGTSTRLNGSGNWSFAFRVCHVSCVELGRLKDRREPLTAYNRTSRDPQLPHRP